MARNWYNRAMKMKFSMLRPAFAAAFCAVLAGCGLLWDDPYVTVIESPLNWIEIHYYNAQFEPIRRVNLRINGAGFVEMKSGTSRLVSDSFAKDFGSDTWEDVHEQRINVEPAHVVDLFQNLVNLGLFDKDKMFRSTKTPSPGRFIAVRANFDNKTYSEPANQYEADPELAEALHNMVLEFHRPILGRRMQR